MMRQSVREAGPGTSFKRCASNFGVRGKEKRWQSQTHYITRLRATLPFAVAALFGLAVQSSAATSPVMTAESEAAARRAITRSVAAGLDFLRSSQNPDGSFGDRQRKLQTGLAVLAFMSSGVTVEDEGQSSLAKACRWLVENSGDDGFIGDGEYPLESNAVAALALSESVGMLGDTELDRLVMTRAEQAFRYALRLQDKASGAAHYGGWKADLKGKANDRRVTAWYMQLLRSHALRGQSLRKSALKRALAFMEGSQKMPKAGASIDKSDLGGCSYDAAGLPVISITAAALTAMSQYERDVERRELAMKWLFQNQPIWYGPNFYFTHYFASRGLTRELRVRNPKHENAVRGFVTRLRTMLREHQNPDGSFQTPPGNAENTQVMGKPYATAMAILILNCDRELLPIDATH